MSDLVFRPQDLGIGHLFERVRDAVIVADAHTGRIVLWNPAATDIFGYSVSEALEMNVEELVPERLRERHRAGLARYRKTGHGPYIDSRDLLELPAVRKSGEEIQIEMSLSPIEPTRDVGDGERRYALAIVRDVTERRRTEEALKESEARFHALVQNALDIVMVTDADGTIRYISPSVERVLSYRSEEMVGTHTAEYVHPDDLESALEELAEATSKPGVHPVAVETRVRHKDGSWRHLEGIANNLLEDPAVRGMVFNHRDVTERKRAEEEVRRLNETLERRVAERTARLEATLADLRASEERYRLLVESAEDYAIFMVDHDGRVADWNAGAERIFGYREGEIVGGPVSILFTPEDIRSGAPEEELRQARTEGRAEDERWHIRKDGTRFWASGVVTPVRDEAGGVRGFAKVARDVTERKEAEKRLREAETRYRTLVEQIPAITYVQEPVESSRPKAVTYMSPQYETLLGYPSESEVIDKEHWLRMLHPEDRERVLAEEVRTDETGEPFEAEYRVIGRDGRIVWLRDQATLVRDEEGRPLYWLGVQYDITEQKRFEEELRQSEQLHRAVVEQAAEGIFLVDVDTKRILEANAAYQNLLGYAPEEITGLTLYDLVPYPRKDMDCYVERVLEQGSYVSGERRHRRRDGSLVDVEVSASVITHGGREAMCIVVHDITERKRAEEALKDIREAERRRIARDLHDGVLQDLSYTTAAMGLISLKAEGTSLEQELQKGIDAVRRAAEGLRAAVNDLRLEEERNRSFSELVQSVVKRNRMMARGQDIGLEVEEDFTTTSFGDVGMEIVRVIQEALTNARRHSGARNVQVTLSKDGEQIVAEVSDDGRGFRPGSTPGGVGLRSMHERVAALRGKLEIESEVGEGTRVRLRVPISQGG